MAGSWRSGLGSALSWFVFPVVPTALAPVFYRLANFNNADPRHWATLEFVFLLGPLGGFAYLAGATAILPDDPGPRGWRILKSLPNRRANWVALGPWLGFYGIGAVMLAWAGLDALLARILDPPQVEAWRRASSLGDMGVPREGVMLALMGIGAYGWLIVVAAAARRAYRRGKLWASIKYGLLTAIGFLGSLVGGFWAATSAFRSYFFDPRIVPLIVFAIFAVTTFSGCGTTTVGDLRRRELFEAMTAAWVLGLAVVWRWLSRERK